MKRMLYFAWVLPVLLLLGLPAFAVDYAPPGCVGSGVATDLFPTPLTPTSVPDYFGCYPNYATSPVIPKFVESLPSLTLATPEICPADPSADCYTIKLIETTWQFHSGLPAPAKVRGYVQVLNYNNPPGTPGTDQPYSYLGPVIVAQSGKPVRVTFINALPTGSGGNLFIPVDTTYMGAGVGPDGANSYTQNRATLHLHGGTTPWISDGTIHQWITPAGESTPYPKGVSVYNVPDMPNPGKPPVPPAVDPGAGVQTFYYTNQQSARLMFYHDHALGITRLNVYAGEAAGYLLTDATEAALTDPKTGVIPGLFPGIPLVIQDRTFVPDNTTPYTNLVGTFSSQLYAQDPTWDTVKWGGPGSLWWPHVYMTNQNPGDISGANPMGRWDYGPWFWPPFTGLVWQPILNPYFDPNCGPPMYCAGQYIPGTPDARQLSGSGVPESFMDTPVINGKAYPTLSVPAGPVRFRILNAANDRFWNPSLWVAADKTTPTTAGSTGTVLCTDNATVSPANCTEVKMVPFNSTQNTAAPFPAWWYDASVPNPFDDRVGGVPDPATRGPAMIQIATEGGFLPAPALILNQPVNYVMNKRDITVGNVREKALFLGPAERADVIVDFTNFAGKTLILYSDAPAPVPAADPRLDYFTGNMNQTLTGGAPSTLPGYGPNTRTLMQIVVGGSGGTAPVDDYNPSTLAALRTALPAAFKASLDTIIVPQAPYNDVYGGKFATGASAYVKISDTTYTFSPIAQVSPLQLGAPVTVDLQPKAIIEDFQMDYGRMNAILGNEIPHTTITNQTSIIQALIDPPVEMVKVSGPGPIQVTPLGAIADGTQLWKFTHNGVDTHAIHFHMFNVQVINRVGWDGAIRPPDANELGFKDTVRMNPLEDIIVATRPIQITLPWKVPNSYRLLNPTKPAGDPTGFTNVAPDGTPVTVTNQLVNYGWEYVYHCHLLGHEENDMMRPLVIAVPPEVPSNLIVTTQGSSATLTWTNNSLNATSFTVQRSQDKLTWTTLATLGSGVVQYTDTTFSSKLTPLWYQVYASNTVGSTVPGYPTLTADSAAVVSATVGAAVAPAAPSGLTATLQSGPQVLLSWKDNSTNEASFLITRNGVNLVTLPANTVTYTDTTVVPGGAYTYQVFAQNGIGASGSNTAAVTVPTIPAAPSSLAVSAVVRNATSDTVTLTWVDNSTNESGFRIQRATDAGFTLNLNTSTLGVNAISTTQVVNRTTNYYYRIQSFNLGGASAWVNATPFPITTP